MRMFVTCGRAGRSLCWPVAWLSSTTVAGPRTRPCAAARSSSAISADPGHLNPAITTSGATHTAAELLYNGLLGRDERGNPVPELAESWQVEQAGAVYRFRLREGVKWHDGAPFTSADVKFTLRGGASEVPRPNQGLDGGGARRASIRRTTAPSCSASSNRTRRSSSSSTPRRRPSSPSTSTRAAIRRRIPPTRAPVGTGPFKFVSTRRARRSGWRATRPISSRACRISTS